MNGGATKTNTQNCKLGVHPSSSSEHPHHFQRDTRVRRARSAFGRESDLVSERVSKLKRNSQDRPMHDQVDFEHAPRAFDPEGTIAEEKGLVTLR